MPKKNLTQQQLADALGINSWSVTACKKRGMPVDSIEAARAWRAANIDPSRMALTPEELAGRPVEDVPEAGGAQPNQNAIGASEFHKVRLRRELAETSIAEMKERELRGDLVRRDVVRSEVAKLAAQLRIAILQIPARLAPTLAHETRSALIERAIDVELRRALEASGADDAAETPA